ncbi:MAG: serine hydrolase [Rhodospirillaceae bacterium]|mgnify:FL=1|jgi:CubicO group peptidase (beta-lactamase class C family)|nr:serine hydrolase [Rhodospirillaceae bacterium]
MRRLSTASLAAAFTLVSLQACAQTEGRVLDMTPEQIQEKIDWVNEAESRDYEFWRRYRDQPDQAAFRQPQDWYNPLILVDGGNQPYLPTADADEAPTISAEALKVATDWAMERETQAFIVYHQGKIRHQAFMDGFHDTSPISSHSWVKTLHGILAGFAVEDGDIKSLDDPIENYLHEWKDDPRGQITVREVLENRTGLAPPFDNPGQPWSLGLQAVEGSDIWGTTLATPLAKEPGTAFAHNNPNTQLLGMILQRATGKNFAAYLGEKLWKPMGAQRGALRKDGLNGNVISYCCFLSAPADWMRIAHLLKDDGKLPDGTQLLPEGWVNQMLSGSEQNPNYGFQIWMDHEFTENRPYYPDMPPSFANKHSEPFAVDDLFYLDGGGKVRIWISRKLDLIVLRTGYPPPKGMGFDEPVLPNTIIRGIF